MPKVLLQTLRKYYGIENQYYNGWTGGTDVNCVFIVSSTNGMIQMCTLNYFGSWHDSTMSEYGIHKKMEDLYHF